MPLSIKIANYKFRQDQNYESCFAIILILMLAKVTCYITDAGC